MEKALVIQQKVKEIVGCVHLVGGSVRDIVMGNDPKDYDFTTPLTPDVVEINIKKSGRKAYIVGKKFGTVGFKVDINGKFIYVEVTTYRNEIYVNGRNPEVNYVNCIDDDLSRRDFTMNAMILHDDGTIYDPHFGQLDIKNKLIKSIGMASARIKEDPLRMLRAARFASIYHFNINNDFVAASTQYASLITTISKERCVQEMDKLLMGDCMNGILFLYKTKLLFYLLPELWLAMNDETVFIFDGTIHDRWATLFHHMTKPYNYDVYVKKEVIVGISHRLKFSNERIKILLT